MDLRYGCHRDPSVVCRVAVNPVGRPGVPFDLKRFDQGRRGLTTFHQVSDLGTGHRIAFYGRGVVNVVNPDLSENLVGLDRSGETAQVAMEEMNFLIESGEDLLQGRPAPHAFPTLGAH